MSGAGGFTPDSAIWRVSREWVLMLGGGRALLLQAAHPLALAGILEHSDYTAGPWARLERTMDAVWTAVYGDPADAEKVGRRVRAIHTKVNGTLNERMGPFPAGTRYDARDPELLMWVHATLLDTALLMYRTYVGPLSLDDQEAYYQEMKALARLFGTPDEAIPPTYPDFVAWWRAMLQSDRICVTPQAREVAEMVLRPPLPLVARPAWEVLNFASVGFLPSKIRRGYGFTWTPAHRALLAASAETVRRALLPLLPDLLRALPGARSAERSHGDVGLAA
jgi:uncharacterized protein (DUF2236 family)